MYEGLKHALCCDVVLLSDWTHSFDTWAFVARWPAPVCISVMSLYRLHILWECPRYNKERQTLNLDGALRSVLGDDRLNVR
jgi:hypothetical protein